jgi:hypothetical protein
MGNVRVAYKVNKGHTPKEIRAGKEPKMKGYQEITCHLLFDVKMDFMRKACFMANESKMQAPLSITYLSAVAGESVRFAFLITVLNALDNMTCDTGNA